MQARLPEKSHVLTAATPTLPQPMAKNIVLPQRTQTLSEYNPHSSQAKSKTQDSAMGSRLSDESETLEQPSANTENTQLSEHAHKPLSRPQQETVHLRLVNSMPALMNEMFEEMTHLNFAMCSSTRRCQKFLHHATDAEAQLEITITELHQAQQQITTLQQQKTTDQQQITSLQQQVANLKEENSHLKADKERLEKEVTVLKGKHYKKERLEKEVTVLKGKHYKNESENITPK